MELTMQKASTPVSFRTLCPEISGTRFSTHGLYSYPAQLIPHIPYYFLKRIKRKNPISEVLDPFCGTGTVMVEALHNGWNSCGIEVNPVAALVAGVKTTPISSETLSKGFTSIRQSYKTNSEREYDLPIFDNLCYWFTERTIRELARIRESIETIKNPKVHNFFRVMFASIVKNVSRADVRIYVPVLPRKGRRRRKPSPWNLFKVRSKWCIDKMREFSVLVNRPISNVQTICDDFREVERDWSNVDIIITSPPYISAQKYVRSTRLEAYWLGYSKDCQLEIDRKTIGSERISKAEYTKTEYIGLEDLDNFIDSLHNCDPVRAGIVSKYFSAMKIVVERLHKILNPGGTCIIVVGNNTAKGREVKTNEYVNLLCQEAGFVLKKIMRDKILSRGLMTKRNGTSSIIVHEWILVMGKD